MERRKKIEAAANLPAPTQRNESLPSRKRHHRSCFWPAILWLFFIGTVFFRSIPRESFRIDKAANLSGVCSGYRGILHIRRGDKEGAAGTIFFLFVINQLLYAEEYNLIPFVHLSDESYHVYDAEHHGKNIPQNFQVGGSLEASWIHYFDSTANRTFGYPGPPVFGTKSAASPATIELLGNGVWNSYFFPVSEYSPTDASCQRLSLLTLSHGQIIPGLHLHAPYAVRSWRYSSLPPILWNTSATYEEWFRPMRTRGALAVQRYIRFRPELSDMARRANPSLQCLAVHIRHSDKANKRRRIPLDNFLPYITTYLESVPDGVVYVATDSNIVVEKLKDTPRVRFQSGAQRSNDTRAVFRLNHQHHETNTQVLVDILSMSSCQTIVHGLSAVSEAVLYVNPKIRSINLEIPQRMSPDELKQSL